MSREKAASGDGGCFEVDPRFQTAAKVRRTSYALTLRLSAASFTSFDLATLVLNSLILKNVFRVRDCAGTFSGMIGKAAAKDFETIFSILYVVDI